LTKIKAWQTGEHYLKVMIATDNKRLRRDAAMLARMVEIYCHDHHGEQEKADFAGRGMLEKIDLDRTSLCPQCAELLIHGLVKRITCPFDSPPERIKPRCKRCPEPCYSDRYRQFVREVMKYSGLKLIRSGRIDLLWKYFY
jgi:hypothetical protein